MTRRRRLPGFDPDRVAACIGYWHIFRHTFNDNPSRAPRIARRESAVAQAKIICQGCPVRVQCLDWALTHGEWHGVWGGTSADERAVLLRRRDAVAGSVV